MVSKRASSKYLADLEAHITHNSLPRKFYKAMNGTTHFATNPLRTLEANAKVVDQTQQNQFYEIDELEERACNHKEVSLDQVLNNDCDDTNFSPYGLASGCPKSLQTSRSSLDLEGSVNENVVTSSFDTLVNFRKNGRMSRLEKNKLGGSLRLYNNFDIW